MNMKKGISVLLVLVLLATAITACTKKEIDKKVPTSPAAVDATEKTENEEKTAYQQEIDKGPVKLTYYQMGDAYPDSDKVWEEINKILKEEINTTVEMIPISWSDYTTKYQLIFNAGENFDLIYTAGWLWYTDLCTKGGFYEITDNMLETYAPASAKHLLGEYHSQYQSTFVNGKSFMVSTSGGTPDKMIALYRKDLAEKYSVPKMNRFEDLYTYLKAIDVNAEDMKAALADVGAGIGGAARWFQGWANDKGEQSWVQVGALDRRALTIINDNEVILPTFTPEYLEYAKIQNELQQRGIISKSANANKTGPPDLMIDGQAALQILPLDGAAGQYSKILEQHPDWKLGFLDIAPDARVGMPYAQAGYSIHATSKYPERTLMVIDMLRNNKKIADLLILGIPGIHWRPVGDDKYESLPGSGDVFPAGGTCPWAYISSDLTRDNVAVPADYINLRESISSKMVSTPIEGFVPDDTNIKMEMAIINDLCQNIYGPLIDTGLTNDVEETIAEFNQKLKDAGIEKVQAEIQKQLDEFLTR